VPGKVLDLGGNIGLFGAWVRGRWPSATIESFEADPANAAVLSRVAASNGGPACWSVSAVAVVNYTGELTFVSGLFGESHLATGDAASDDRPGGRTVTVPTVDLFEQDHNVDVLKMDIEGGEWSILTDSRMAGLQADVIVLEWHAIGCPEPDPRAAASRLLTEAGYPNVEEVDVATYCGVMWAWRDDPVFGNGR
jgi:FkbM family methyltransferase